jgi:hypothetical protein
MRRGFDWFTDALKFFGTLSVPRTAATPAESETMDAAAPERITPVAAIAVENAITIEPAVEVEAAPEVEAASDVETAPDVEVDPVIEEADPLIEEASLGEADPVVEAEPVTEAAPVVEAASVVEAVPDSLDDERRRTMVRELFNGYWDGLDDKPPTFAERLDAAEDYINERLAERNVGWRLDAETRRQLGLPRSRLPLRPSLSS